MKIFAKNKRKWFTTCRLSELTGMNKGSVVRACNQMFKFGEISRKDTLLNSTWGYSWRFK